MKSEKQKELRLLLVEVLKSAPILFARMLLDYAETGMRDGESYDSQIQYIKLMRDSDAVPSLEKLPTLVVEALSFAIEALHDEYLPYHKVRVPFIAHVYRVIALLIESGVNDENIMAAAALHHAVEKGIVGLGDVLALFGEDVWHLVQQLTTVVEFDNATGDEWRRMETRVMKVISASPNIKDGVIKISSADAIVFGNNIILGIGASFF